MNLWKRALISLLLIFIFLAALQIIKYLEIQQATVGYFVLITWSVASLLAAIGVILITLVQFFPKRAEEREKEEQRKIEELFTYEALRSASADEFHEKVERYKNRSTFAKTLSNPKIDNTALGKKILDSYREKKVRKSVEYFLSSDKGYQALGVIIKHLIGHHKIPTYEAYLLEKELKHLMPKRDIIDLYEKVK